MMDTALEFPTRARWGPTALPAGLGPVAGAGDASSQQGWMRLRLPAGGSLAWAGIWWPPCSRKGRGGFAGLSVGLAVPVTRPSQAEG